MSRPQYGPEVDKVIEVLLKRPVHERPTHAEILRRLNQDEAGIGYAVPIKERAYYDRVKRVKAKIENSDEPIPLDQIVSTVDAERAEIVSMARSERKRLKAQKGLTAQDWRILDVIDKLLANAKRRNDQTLARSSKTVHRANEASRDSLKHKSPLQHLVDMESRKAASTSQSPTTNGDSTTATNVRTTNKTEAEKEGASDLHEHATSQPSAHA